MSKRLLVVNGHPDPRPERFCAALCEAYAAGARERGFEVERVDVGALAFPYSTATEESELSESLTQALQQIRAADRLAIVFPLWLDGPPGMLRELFEYYARATWSHAGDTADKPADAIVTMDMPAFIQRAKLREDRTKKRLAMPGVRLSEPLLIGTVQNMSAAQREEWLQNVRARGANLA